MTSISRLLSQHTPTTPDEATEQGPDVIALDDDAADEVFSALTSQTTRRILSALYEAPQPPSDIADTVDTSLQNVNYHIHKLEDADLIEVVDSTYSNQGKEMSIYAPTNQALVLFASNDIDEPSLVDALKQLLGFVGVFALISLLIDPLIRRLATSTAGGAGGGGGGAGGTGGTVPASSFPLPPALIFFAGAVLAALIITGWWYYQNS
ncbi:MAG: ArsR/SmtB family transcription factor [Halorhabdus sp.]